MEWRAATWLLREKVQRGQRKSEPRGSSDRSLGSREQWKHSHTERRSNMEDEEAGSLSEPDVSASSLGVSSFLPSLTERQFRVMQGGMSVELTKDEMTHMIRNVVKIVSTISLNIIVPKLEERSNKDNSAGSSDQDPLRSCCTADMGETEPADLTRTRRNLTARHIAVTAAQDTATPLCVVLCGGKHSGDLDAGTNSMDRLFQACSGCRRRKQGETAPSLVSACISLSPSSSALTRLT
ncbi:hypothetical protein MHYP_G00048420 [Metynnis hypsauchen]